MPLPPAIVDDGNFTLAQQSGAPEYSFPFARRGDNKTFVAKVTMVVDVDSYVPPISMSQRMFPNLGRGYMLDFDEPQMKGQRLLTYGVYYGNVPCIPGIEYGSTTYTYQRLIQAPSGSDSSIIGYSDLFDAVIFTEYSIFRPLPQLFYLHYILAPFNPPTETFQAIFQAGFILYGGPASEQLPGQLLALSQNSIGAIYRGRIFQRQTIWARLTPALVNPRALPLPPA